MSRRLHIPVNLIDSLTLQNAGYRLVMYFPKHMPKDVAESPEIELTKPEGVIASPLAIQPEALSRILAKLKRRRIIRSARLSYRPAQSTLRARHGIRLGATMPPEAYRIEVHTEV